ncbi:MAG: hypothetical protein AAF514_24585 [Verrucomicrobiota bacterium]
MRIAIYYKLGRFQRCRERARKKIEADAFLNQIRGKGFSELRSMLNESASKLVPGNLKVASGEQALAVTTLRSALKTILVTEIVWDAHLNELKKKAEGADGPNMKEPAAGG